MDKLTYKSPWWRKSLKQMLFLPVSRKMSLFNFEGMRGSTFDFFYFNCRHGIQRHSHKRQICQNFFSSGHKFWYHKLVWNENELPTSFGKHFFSWHWRHKINKKIKKIFFFLVNISNFNYIFTRYCRIYFKGEKPSLPLNLACIPSHSTAAYVIFYGLCFLRVFLFFFFSL